MQSKLPHVGTTIFTVMSNLAGRHNAINLSQDSSGLSHLFKTNFVCKRGHAVRFQPICPHARPARISAVLAQKIERTLSGNHESRHRNYHHTGGHLCHILCLHCHLQPGNEVIVLEPAYDSYIPNIHLNGARAVCVALQYPDYSVNWQKVKEAISPKTKSRTMINTPHNPQAMCGQRTI